MSDPLFPDPDADSTIMIPRPGGGRRPPAPPSYSPPPPPPSSAPAPWAGEGPPQVGVNPLIASASVLLSTVPTIRRTLSHQNPLALREYLLRAMGDFEASARRANASPEHVLIGRYALCTMIDETVMVMPWGASSSWSRESLLVTLHKEGFGGEKFFLLLDKALEDPRRNLDLIELMYACLALGFEGRYRVVDNGKAQLEALRDRVYNIIRRERGEFDRDLSPHWRGVQKSGKPLVRRIPAWIVLAAVALFVFVFYVVYLTLLSRSSDPVFAAVSAIRADPGNLQRANAALVAPVAVTPRLRPLLLNEIQQGLLDVVEDSNGTQLILRGDSLYASGSADIKPTLLPLIDRIGQELSKVPGQITVTGHTDNVPSRGSLRFPSNFELSVERARGVSTRLTQFIKDPARIKTEGVADSRPLVPNTTAEGRARNRRVEIVLRNPA